MSAKMQPRAALESEPTPKEPNPKKRAPIPELPASGPPPDWFAVRALVDSRYDFQRLRIAIGHRRLRILRSWITELQRTGLDHDDIASLISNTRIDRVYPPQKVTASEVRDIVEELAKEAEEEAGKAKEAPDYKPRTDYPEIRATKHTDEIFYLLRDLEEKEARIEKHLKPVAESTITGHWLLEQRGIGPVLACGLLAYFDPARARHASSYWKFAGLAVSNGHADRLVAAKVIHPKSGPCRECDCTKYEADPVSEDELCTCGHALKIEGQKAPYSKMAKWLCFNVASSFLKSGSPYKRVYDEAKVFYLAKYGTKAGQKDHAHKAAMRKMVKRFLVEFWKVGRAEAGLPIDEPYIFGPGGHSNPEPDLGKFPE